MVRYTGSVASLLSALITTSLAKNTSVPSSLIGCEEVSCPRAYGDTDTCTVANEVFMGIGLAPVPDVPCSLTGISLIKAVNASTYGKSEFRTVYYLGTPPDLDLGGLEGCAVFFHDSAALFKPEGEDVRATRGVCRDVIEHECIDELPKQARNSVSDWNKEPSTEHPCKALRDDLWDSPVDGCGDMSGDGLGIGRIAVVSLGDLSPISKIQNESSNCWPVVPKSNDLTVLTSDTVEGQYTYHNIMDEVYKITPVLTVFYPSRGNDSLVGEPVSQMTCVKVISTEYMWDDSQDAASSYRGNMFAAALVFLGVLTGLLR